MARLHERRRGFLTAVVGDSASEVWQKARCRRVVAGFHGSGSSLLVGAGGAGVSPGFPHQGRWPRIR